MYSYEDRIRAVKLYIKLGKHTRPTIGQLGYPTKNALKIWHREYEHSRDLQVGYVRLRQKYSTEQMQAAVLPMRPGQLERSRTTTSATAPRTCSPRSMCGPAQSSARCTGATAVSISGTSWPPSSDPLCLGWTCTWCWTTPALTRHLLSSASCCAIPACICTSRPPRRPGSTWWSAGSPS